MAVGSNRLGRLHQMLDLAELGVRVAVIDQGVEKLHGFPDTHAGTRSWQVFGVLGPHESEGLVRVIQTVEFSNAGTDILSVVAEARLLFRLRITIEEKVF